MQTGQALLALENRIKIIGFLLPWTFAIGSWLPHLIGEL